MAAIAARQMAFDFPLPLLPVEPDVLRRVFELLKERGEPRNFDRIRTQSTKFAATVGDFPPLTIETLERRRVVHQLAVNDPGGCLRSRREGP